MTENLSGTVGMFYVFKPVNEANSFGHLLTQFVLYYQVPIYNNRFEF